MKNLVQISSDGDVKEYEADVRCSELVRSGGQLSIDGCTVTNCEELMYADSWHPICGETGLACEGREDCLFKKYSRKCKECEEKDYLNNQLRQEITRLTLSKFDN